MASVGTTPRGIRVRRTGAWATSVRCSTRSSAPEWTETRRFRARLPARASGRKRNGRACPAVASSDNAFPSGSRAFEAVAEDQVGRVDAHGAVARAADIDVERARGIAFGRADRDRQRERAEAGETAVDRDLEVRRRRIAGR